VVLLVNLQELHYAVSRGVLVGAVLAWEGYGFYAAKKLLSGDRRGYRRLIQAVCVVSAVALSVYIWRTGTSDLSQWAQVEIFLSAAVLYGVAHRRNTPAGVLATVGFTLWAMIYAWSVGSMYRHLMAHQYILQMCWILPKYLVTFSMVLKIFEEAQDEKAAMAEQNNQLYEDFRRIYESNPHPIWICDAGTGRFLTVNQASLLDYGYSEDEFLAMRVQDIEVTDNVAAEPFQSLLPQPPEAERTRYRRKDGSVLSANVAASKIMFDGRESRQMIVRDITERLRLNHELARQAHHDVLTGLPNRKLLADRMELALQRSVRDGKKTAVFAIDIDHFKKVNDTHGHAVGDACLKAVADRLNSKIRNIDTLARTGGEEFVAVIGGLGNAADAERIAHHLLGLFAPPLQLHECALAMTVSIGVAIFPDDANDAETLYKLSDEALYAAKRNGRNRVELANARGVSA
jgi:diguanylate cyclase (GGDEF)-like protein/PAS domain S-box-containing protein